MRSVTTSARRRQLFNVLKSRAGAVTSWLRQEIATHLAQPALPWRNRKYTGALSLHRQWEYCQFLPVLAGEQTPLQLQWTSRINIDLRGRSQLSTFMYSYRAYGGGGGMGEGARCQRTIFKC